MEFEIDNQKYQCISLSPRFDKFSSLINSVIEEDKIKKTFKNSVVD
jgi:hypothetical protein